MSYEKTSVNVLKNKIPPISNVCLEMSRAGFYRGFENALEKSGLVFFLNENTTMLIAQLWQKYLLLPQKNDSGRWWLGQGKPITSWRRHYFVLGSGFWQVCTGKEKVGVPSDEDVWQWPIEYLTEGIETEAAVELNAIVDSSPGGSLNLSKTDNYLLW